MDQPTPAPGQQTPLVDILLAHRTYAEHLRGGLDAYQLVPHLLNHSLFQEGKQL
jgi:hypothetical protein